MRGRRDIQIEASFGPMWVAQASGRPVFASLKHPLNYMAPVGVPILVPSLTSPVSDGKVNGWCSGIRNIKSPGLLWR